MHQVFDCAISSPIEIGQNLTTQMALFVRFVHEKVYLNYSLWLRIISLQDTCNWKALRICLGRRDKINQIRFFRNDPGTPELSNEYGKFTDTALIHHRQSFQDSPLAPSRDRCVCTRDGWNIRYHWLLLLLLLDDESKRQPFFICFTMFVVMSESH